VYSDQGAFDAHLASSHFIDFDVTVRDWIIGKRVVTLQHI
jgi:quinol monooxygenase YgiN